jgi:hypothetical protein
VAAADKITGWQVSSADLARMDAAAAVVIECRRALAANPAGILSEIMAGRSAPEAWRHYPAGEVYDPQTHAQYFYHVHPTIEESGGQPGREHGHFHTFLRAEGMPLGMAPLVLPETAVAAMPSPPPQAAPLKHGARDEVSHLVAIALDQGGEPFRLFTTNRWVTGETWYRADDVVRMLDHFTIGEPGRLALLNGWIGAMIGLFRPQISALLRTRDETMMAWRRRRRTNVFEDTRLEITSSIEIDIGGQLDLLERIRSHPGLDVSPRTPALPRMAEGWGEGHVG